MNLRSCRSEEHYADERQKENCETNSRSADYEKCIVFDEGHQNANDHKFKKSKVSQENSSKSWLSHKATKKPQTLDFKFPESHFSPFLLSRLNFKVFGKLFSSLLYGFTTRVVTYSSTFELFSEPQNVHCHEKESF